MNDKTEFMLTRHFLKRLLPPVLTDALNSFLMMPERRRIEQTIEPISFVGDFSSWEEAEQASTKYDTPEILAKTRNATLKVKNGEAIFERDSVIFNEAQYSFPLLAGLLRAAVSSGRLNVLDFGGALGSTYFQNRLFLSVINGLQWKVVEQPDHVACGQAEMATEELKFYQTIEECLHEERPNVLLLSGVVQYLSSPYEFLAKALSYNLSYVIVDRTPFMRNGSTRLTVEHVPEWIYKASYPAWFLSEERFMECFYPQYNLITSFSALDAHHPEGGEADYKGFIFELKS